MLIAMLVVWFCAEFKFNIRYRLLIGCLLFFYTLG